MPLNTPIKKNDAVGLDSEKQNQKKAQKYTINTLNVIIQMG